MPDTDCVVGVTSEEGLSVCGPGQGETLWWVGLGGGRYDLWAEFFDGLLASQILKGRSYSLIAIQDENARTATTYPNLNGRSVGDAQPVTVWREAQSVDDVVVVQSVQVLAVIQVPEKGLVVLASGGAEGAVGRDGDGIQVATVAVVVVL